MLHILEQFEHFDQMLDVVAIDRADVLEAHLLENLMGRHGGFDALLQMIDSAVDSLTNNGNLGQKCFGPLFDFIVGATAAETGEAVSQPALRRRDPPAVVVENDQKLSLKRTGLVESLDRNAIDDTRIPHQRNDAIVAPHHCIATRDSHRGWNGCSRVPDIEQIVLALGDARESA